MPRHLNFKFQFPVDIGELYDFKDGIVYMWGNHREDGIEDTIDHGVLHYVIQKIAGKGASLLFDNLTSKHYKID